MKTNDCVSREKVAYMITNGKYANENYEQFIDRLIKELGDLPSVNPTRKVGEWLVEEGDRNNYGYGSLCCCSNCKDYFTLCCIEMKYCPNCGAKMKTKSEREE
jgi:hypothetical protein